MRFLLPVVLGFCGVVLTGCQTVNSVTEPLAMQNAGSDDAITRSVNSAILGTGEYEGLAIGVMTEGSVVTLTGFVKTIKQYDTAVKIASEVNGVRGVRNHLVIRK